MFSPFLPSSTATPFRLLDLLRSLHETPINGDRLAHNCASVQRIACSTRLFVRLELDESVTLQESGTSVEIQMHVLDVAELAELVMNVLFLRLLVNGGDKQDPSLDGCKCI